MAEVKKLLLDGVDSPRINPVRRQYRTASLRLHAQDDVAAAEVVEIVGKSTDRVQGRERVSSLLELQALPLHGLAVNQGVEVDREGHG